MQLYRTLVVRIWLCLLFLGLLSAASSAQQPAPSDAENAEQQGAKLIRAAIEARGGDRYINIKSLFATGQYTPFRDGISTTPVAFEDTFVYPDKERVEFGRGKKKDRRIQVNVGGSGWVYDGDAETLKDILKTDVIARMTREFKMEGFELVIDETVLDHIVADAIKRETGARGLASTLTRNLEDVAFGSFGIETKGEVHVIMRDGDIAVDIA